MKTKIVLSSVCRLSALLLCIAAFFLLLSCQSTEKPTNNAPAVSSTDSATTSSVADTTVSTIITTKPSTTLLITTTVGTTTTTLSTKAITKTSPNKTTTTQYTCTHTDPFGAPPEDGIRIITGWADLKPGIENRREVFTLCTEKCKVIYKCERCLQPVLYEELEPMGHDFSGKEEIFLYPNTKEEGSYGKRCQRFMCKETILTTPIPKRNGDYSSIDPHFTVGLSFDQQEHYYFAELDVTICDERTWGSVPTIKYNPQTRLVFISFLDQYNEIYSYSAQIDVNLIEQGYSLIFSILEEGIIKGRYSRFVFSGTSS